MLLLNNHNVKERFAREEASVSASVFFIFTTLVTEFIVVFPVRGIIVRIKRAPYGPAEFSSMSEAV